jgi:Uma2 family endonuclease
MSGERGTAMATTSTKTEIEYPESDGKPLAKTGIHVRAIFLLLDALTRRYHDDSMVATLVNMFLYYEEGNVKKQVAPDVFVTLGVPANPFRRTFKVWEEGKAPDLIIEVTSRSTKKEDQKTKFELYQNILKVREYILFDPLDEYLKPALQGFRLEDGRYVPIETVAGRLPSNVIDLHFERSGSDLRLFDPRTDRWIPVRLEVDDAAMAERRKSEVDLRHAEAARQNAEAEKQNAEAEKQNAEAEKQKAEAENREFAQALSASDAKRSELEREIERLRRELERRDPGTSNQPPA